MGIINCAIKLESGSRQEVGSIVVAVRKVHWHFMDTTNSALSSIKIVHGARSFSRRRPRERQSQGLGQACKLASGNEASVDAFKI